MTHATTAANHADSTTVDDDVTLSQTKVSLSSFTQKLWEAIVNAFKVNHEPIFRQLRDRNGDSYWEVYEPASGRTIYFASDDEARLWLDQSRPYR